MLIAVRHDRDQPYGLRRNIAERHIAVRTELDHPNIRLLHRVYPLLAARTLRLAHFTPVRYRRLSDRGVSKTGGSQDFFKAMLDDDQGNVAYASSELFAPNADRSNDMRGVQEKFWNAYIRRETCSQLIFFVMSQSKQYRADVRTK